MIILGIETSCDETALALIESRSIGAKTEIRVLDSLIHSQADLHSKYGGVFPNLAKREHGKNLVPLFKRILENTAENFIEKEHEEIAQDKIEKVLYEFKDEFTKNNPDLYESIRSEFPKNRLHIDKIAVTEGPGLEPTLWVGINFARFLSTLYEVPILPINHMEGHVLGSLLNDDSAMGDWQQLKAIQLPAMALLISGGHTELVEVTKDGHSFKYSIVGQTVDDAVGEAFDKVARLLGLPYPGGPHISALALQAEKDNIQSQIKLPRPMIHSKDLNFSFAGLKTAVLYAVQKADKNQSLNDDFKKGLAREFEDAVAETLVAKLSKALEASAAKSLIIGGGVSANLKLQKAFTNLAEQYGIPIYLPSKHISGDNALMIAVAGTYDRPTQNRNLRAQGTKKLGLEN